MPGPSQAWQNIASTEVDQDSPETTTVLEKYRTNQIHLKEVLIGTGRGDDETPHNHALTGRLSAPWSENLLADSAPGGQGGDAAWTYNGWALSGGGTNGIAANTTAGNGAYQIIYRLPTVSKAAFGTSGADIVLSLWVKSQGVAPTAGEIWFGLADGSTSAFLANCKGVIDCAAGAVTTSWKRFHMKLSAKGGGATTDVRFLMRNGTTPPNQSNYINMMAANLGESLTYWTPAVNENTSGHNKWQKYAYGPPALEKASAITNSTLVTGV